MLTFSGVEMYNDSDVYYKNVLLSLDDGRMLYITGSYLPVKRKRWILKVVRGCKLVPYLGFVFFVISDPFQYEDEHPHESPICSGI